MYTWMGDAIGRLSCDSEIVVVVVVVVIILFFILFLFIFIIFIIIIIIFINSLLYSALNSLSY